MHLLFAVLLLGHWLLASDLHVEPEPGAPVAAPYGDDTNWALFDSTVKAMHRADPNPQVVILSGDFLEHHFPHDSVLAERTMARIAGTFNAAFPHAQFIIVPGNNDDPCGDYRATPGDPYFNSLARIWAPLVNRGGAAPDFERDFGDRGWYSARLPLKGMRAFALDSVYWSVLYHGCGYEWPGAPKLELQWLSSALRGLPKNVRAMLVMHIPPGVDPHSTLIAHRLLVVPFLHADLDAQFVRILSSQSRRIAFAIAGHMHRDDFRILGGVPLLIAPSVSPIYDNDAAFLRLDVASDGTLQNYTPYMFDHWSNAWYAGDSFDATFGVNSFTAPALTSLHARLRTDEALRAKWALLVMSGSHYREITSGNWTTYWCAQTEIGNAYVTCAGLGRRLTVLPIVAGIVVALVLALLAWLWYSFSRSWKRRSKSE